ncbi:acyl carrier protein [Mucilaginibacter sp.]|uniref:acyl carrier protein n=1 Tax=Mucilaginibacter sp. TaxID=1882438 RepID=UPI00326634D1
MDIEKFVQEFANQFDMVPAEEFTPETHFKENEEWDSMTALSIIAMADDSYNVRLTGDDIRTSVTVQDIFDIVVSKVK